MIDIEGVEVLYTSLNESSSELGTGLILMGTMITIIIALFYFIWGTQLDDKLEKSFLVTSLIILIIFGICPFITGNIINSKINDYYTYEVLIKDNADMPKLLEEYEIIEQRGQILTIKEKTDVN